MKFHTQKKHMVDLLFTIALFLVFAASSLSVILISSNAYRQIEAKTKSNYTTRTSLSYIAQKIRQNDTDGGISLGKLKDKEALILKQTLNGDTYCTYIYQYKRELKELFVKEGSDIAPSAGKTIMKIESFTMESANEHLYRFTATGPDGNECELLIGPRSM